jgi:hypothetical protein
LSGPPGIAGYPRHHGPGLTAHGVVFNLWAPSANVVDLLEDGRPPRRIPKGADGWYQILSVTAHRGTRYQFRINEELVVPDPASRFQPDGVERGPLFPIDIDWIHDLALFATQVLTCQSVFPAARNTGPGTTVGSSVTRPVAPAAPTAPRRRAAIAPLTLPLA